MRYKEVFYPPVEKEEIWDLSRLTKTCSSNRRRITMVENNIYGILLVFSIIVLAGLVGTILSNHNQLTTQNEIIDEYAQSVFQMRTEIDELTNLVASISADADNAVSRANETEEFVSFAYEEMERVWAELNLLKSIFDQVEIAE